MPSVQIRTKGRTGVKSPRHKSSARTPTGPTPPGFGANLKMPSKSSRSMNKGKRSSRGDTTATFTATTPGTTTTTTRAATTTTTTTASITTLPFTTTASKPSTTLPSKMLTIIKNHKSDDDDSEVDQESFANATTTATAATGTLAPNTTEIEKAAGYIVSLLQPHLPHESSAIVLKNKLMPALASRFSAHWHPSAPAKGSGYRCVRSEPGKPDPTVLACLVAELGSSGAVRAAGKVLPFAVWTDPGEVSVRLGERGHITMIHSENGNAAELTAANIASCATTPPRRRATSFEPANRSRSGGGGGSSNGSARAAVAAAQVRRGRSSSPGLGLSPAARSFSPSSGSEDGTSGGRSPPASPQMAGRAASVEMVQQQQQQQQQQQHFQFLSPPQMEIAQTWNDMGFGGYRGVPHHFQQQQQQQAAF